MCLGLGLAVETPGPLVTVVVHPPGEPSLAVSMPCRGDQCGLVGMPLIYAPAARACVIGRIGHLFASAGIAVPTILDATAG